ncbi:MAG: IPTL-CTERM sorting domain-containing protein [Ectothiorhodospiraceae bacterium]|nr:IPTL-CTERM sorting domain-containing protein [Ectothiorhodospiraceae bacterium]
MDQISCLQRSFSRTPQTGRSRRSGPFTFHPGDPMRILPILLLFLSTPVFAALNDTGQGLCYDGASLVTCNSGNTGDGAIYPRQDGRFGRDAQAAAGLLSKTGAGAVGFDFTRICMSGEAAGTGTCPANPTPGTEPNDWACTRDNVTGLVWSIETIGPGDWNAATTTHPANHNGAIRCGFGSDWRVPHSRELQSILHHGVTDPAIDVAFFPDTLSNWYWSMDEYAPNTDSVWLVNFFDGSDLPGEKTLNGGSVRLVHGAPIPDGNFTVNGDATVQDDSTGLTWDRCSWGQNGSDCASGSASIHTWAEALGVAVTANAMNYKGYNDWRLPNRTDLESLVAISTPVLAIDAATFPNTPATPFYWTSTTYAYATNDAWYIDFAHGISPPAGAKTTPMYVRLVRGGQSFDALASGAAHVPTLSEWGMILLSLLIAGLAVFSLRRDARSFSSMVNLGREGVP